MKTLLLLLTIFMVPKAFSQLNNVFQPKPWEYQKYKAAQPKLTYRNQLKKSFASDSTEATEDKSVLKLRVTPEYKGNNGKGADIYAMQPYNMPCLVPDSTFHSRMPVKRSVMISKAEW
jgi:hypothetical protein